MECAHIFEDRGGSIKICRKCSYIHDATQVSKYNAPQDTSDGYHTFEELYEHRMALFSVICNTYKDKAWKSKLHDDGTMFKDYFIVGITTEEGEYTYHYHLDYWDYFNVKEIDKAPKWDGHKPSDYTRLFTLVAKMPSVESMEVGDLVTPKKGKVVKFYSVESVEGDSVRLVNKYGDRDYSKDFISVDDFISNYRLVAKSNQLKSEKGNDI